jgi:hypothetical protein
MNFGNVIAASFIALLFMLVPIGLFAMLIGPLPSYLMNRNRSTFTHSLRKKGHRGIPCFEGRTKGTC